MTSRSGIVLVILLLSSAAATVLAMEARLQGGREKYTVEFQRLLGGFGFGPALDLSVCPFGFDPRLDSDCAQEYAPLPGGTCFCPRHAGSLLNYPPPPHPVPVLFVENGDAPPP